MATNNISYAKELTHRGMSIAGSIALVNPPMSTNRVFISQSDLIDNGSYILLTTSGTKYWRLYTNIGNVDGTQLEEPICIASDTDLRVMIDFMLEYALEHSILPSDVNSKHQEKALGRLDTFFSQFKGYGN